jgi:predicted metalloprotease
MRWDDFRRSDNIEDRRDDGGGFGGGGGIPIPGGGGGLGIGAVIILGLIGWALGVDPRLIIGGAEMLSRGSTGGYQQQQLPRSPRSGRPTDEMGDFVAAVLGEVDDRWQEIFARDSRTYRGPRIVLFRGQTQAGCGFAQAQMGPFYCPADRKVYLDTSFFREVETRFRGCEGKACKFTQAYIIAHEVGHHVQNQLGVLTRAHQAQQAAGSRAEANRIQVRVELQADCFAGVWANAERQKRANYLEPGDVDAALQTASAIGDDTLQRRAQGRVVPDAFTHGSAEQRKRWFMRGFTEGKVSSCNTFSPQAL